METATLHAQAQATSNTRIQSIDFLRGVVIIIMALDHVRDYFHGDAFLYNPLNLDKTTAAVFMTRWVTHYCAPIFIFLAGTSAFLVGMRKSKKELSVFLLTRGLWLIILELTVMNFAWFFNTSFSLIVLQVIFALGFGMIAMAAFIHFRFNLILTLGLVFVAGHNLLDKITFPGNGWDAVGWALLHEYRLFTYDTSFLFIGYPIIAWTGIMMLGYCFGKLYKPEVDSKQRQKTLLAVGVIAIALFVVLRTANLYGDPSPWSEQKNSLFTFLSILNVTKYPPSLLFILITLGPAMIFLALSERFHIGTSNPISALGRVPLFFYIIHVYTIHILAVVAALLTGFTFNDMVFNTWITDSPNLRGYGLSLGMTYLIWIAIVLILLPLCLWYDGYKRSNREKKWLSYL